MPKKLKPEEYETILHAVTRHPDGVRISVLEKQLKGAVSRRTLIRRLGELVGQGRLRRQGEGRALVYILSSAAPSTPIIPNAGRIALEGGAPTVEVYVPLSKAGEEVRAHVRQPLTRRTPVGYKREFLDRYIPNQTFYLPENVRNHLQLIGRTPAVERPAGTYAREIYDRLLIDLSWASSRLEGNTYSRLETEKLIEFGQAADGKDAHETQMILNHKGAIELLIDHAEDIGFNSYTFRNLHTLLSENLLNNPDASGRLRQIPVEIDGTTFHPLSVPQVIEECFRQILDTATAIKDPFEQAFFVMVQLPYLQPFEDVNKRVSRVGANISFFKNNLCPLSFVDVPERAYIDATLGIYELNNTALLQDVFVWAYERSCQQYVALRQSMTAPDPFRMRYRQALFDLVARIVRERIVEPKPLVRQYAAGNVSSADRKTFMEMMLAELNRMHEGSLARYKLRISEYRAWKEALDKAKHENKLKFRPKPRQR